VNPDDNDVKVPDGEDHDDFRDFSNYATFLANRVGNPEVRVDIDYQADFIKTSADISPGNVKITGVRGDGLGNTEEEIEYDAAEQPYSIKAMTYDALGRMIALTDPDAGTTSTQQTVHDTVVERYDKTWIVKYDDLGRKKIVIYPDTTPGKIDMKTITYDDLNNTVTTTDPEGRTVVEMMDWNGNLVELEHRGDGNTPASDYQVYTY
jgi:YD repeat-containing protein